MSLPHPIVLACKDVVEATTELLGGALAPIERARLEQHLLVCPPCTIHLAQLRATIALARDLAAPGEPEAAPAIAPALLAAFRKERTP